MPCLCHCLLLFCPSRATEAPCGHMGEGNGPSGASGGGGATGEFREWRYQQTQQVSGMVCVTLSVCVCGLEGDGGA